MLNPTVKMWSTRVKQISMPILIMLALGAVIAGLWLIGVVGAFYLITVAAMSTVALIIIIPQLRFDALLRFDDSWDRGSVGVMSLLAAACLYFILGATYASVHIPNKVLRSSVTDSCYKSHAATRLQEYDGISIWFHYRTLYNCATDGPKESHSDIVKQQG